MSEQSEQNAPERCSCCTCGYTWVKGQYGGHSCAQVMEVTLADLRARLAKYEDAEGRPLQHGCVVLPEPLKRGDEGGSGEYGAAMIRGFNACLREVARLNSSPVSSAPSHSEQVRHMVPQMVDFSPVPDDFRSQANGYRAGWNDCRAAIAAAPSAGSQKEQGE